MSRESKTRDPSMVVWGGVGGKMDKQTDRALLFLIVFFPKTIRLEL